MIDFVAVQAQADATGPVVIPFAFSPGALNRNVVLFAAMHHATTGILNDPILEPVTCAGVQFFGVRFSEQRGEGIPVPVRDYLWQSNPDIEPPLSGEVVIPLRPISTPHNVVAHVIGLRGAVWPGHTDDNMSGSPVGPAGISLLTPIDPFALIGVALRGDPTPGTESPGEGIVINVGDAVAGTVAGSVRGTVWLGDTSGTYRINLDSGLGLVAATALAFKGGAATGEAPEAPAEDIGLYTRFEFRARTGIVIPR